MITHRPFFSGFPDIHGYRVLGDPPGTVKDPLIALPNHHTVGLTYGA
ncbi:hypothetical protein SXIM_07060 [Streptomyces xiamenensis]|uniref:Uncharacterized protein n=1 Tax=Streptomyces xiamenensis TaxID=408015 RepID=A0A0F7FRF6_9ACTN|nr:hypothetical protein SXIM_07060 [Streptomyces xiamenensis]